MSNMSHCRFENTASDLSDCWDHFCGGGLSEDEERARLRIIKLAKEIYDNHGYELE